MLDQFIRDGDHRLVNPASIDIRIGKAGLWDIGDGDWAEKEITEEGRYIEPNQLVLVETFEFVTIPVGFAAELKLKSSTARMGFNHSLAFWVDPGWNGILTMEITNLRRGHDLKIHRGMRFAQMIIHRLDTDVEVPYQGRYQNALGVQPEKMEHTG